MFVGQDIVWWLQLRWLAQPLCSRHAPRPNALPSQTDRHWHRAKKSPKEKTLAKYIAHWQACRAPGELNDVFIILFDNTDTDLEVFDTCVRHFLLSWVVLKFSDSEHEWESRPYMHSDFTYLMCRCPEGCGNGRGSCLWSQLKVEWYFSFLLTVIYRW